MKKSEQEIVQKIFRTNIGAKKSEKILVFTDSTRGGLRTVADQFVKTAGIFTSRTDFVTFPQTSNHGIEPPEILWHKAFGERIYNALRKERLLLPLISKNISEKRLTGAEEIVRRFETDASDVVIALSHYSTSHTRFRDLLTRVCGTRYASMPLFDRTMFRTALRADPQEMAQRSGRIAGRLKKCNTIEITTPNGTAVTFQKGDRKVRCDTGIIRNPGEFSNLPAGEVYLAPIEGSANGRLVLEWAPTRRLKQEITLVIQDGQVRMVRGKEEYARYLRRKLAERPENRNIAELGIGTNDMASRPDNILESEKILGTIHIALGDNSSFGGKVRTPFHQDFVFFQPTVTLINRGGVREVLLKDGILIP